MHRVLRSHLRTQQPDISILLNSPKTTFTTLEKIDGIVNITAPSDTNFIELEIQFVGTNRSYVEGVPAAAAIYGKSEACHIFLKLCQPQLQEYFPEDCILKAGVTYEFPFVFVVPEQLLPRVCQHRVSNRAVRAAHLQLPPSLGDRELMDHLKIPDDFSPVHASVRYGVFARLLRNVNQNGEKKTTVIAAKAKRVRIIPASSEMLLREFDLTAECCIRKERRVKSGMLKQTLGVLVVETAQPQPLRIPSHDNAGKDQPSTLARIALRFDPVDENGSPPGLGNLVTTLEVSTFCATIARQQFPNKQMAREDTSGSIHVHYRTLSRRCLAGVKWAKKCLLHPGIANGFSSQLPQDLTATPSEAYRGGSYYSTQILMPILLPLDETFVPSFHSCLLSRVYTLNMSLQVYDGSMMNSSVDLYVPIQISSEGRPLPCLAGTYSLPGYNFSLDSQLDDERRTRFSLHRAAGLAQEGVFDSADVEAVLPVPPYSL